MTRPPTGSEVLDLELPANDARANTVREYLCRLLSTVWIEGDDFSGKRPFGNSDWRHELYEPLAKAGWINARWEPYGDGPDELVELDQIAADELILQAIRTLS